MESPEVRAKTAELHKLVLEAEKLKNPNADEGEEDEEEEGENGNVDENEGDSEEESEEDEGDDERYVSARPEYKIVFISIYILYSPLFYLYSTGRMSRSKKLQ